MAQTSATFRSLPTEIITKIFILSSNPSLALICRELNHILAPLTRSIAIRTDFLLVRYRNNYVKAVAKGLRWAFFDLELLKALDRSYLKQIMTRQSCQARLEYSQPGTKRDRSSLLGHDQEPSTTPTHNHTSLDLISNTPQRSEVQAPPRKKRKKYADPLQEISHIPPSTDNKGCSTEAMDASTTCPENGIPLPKDFAMPRRLFKSSVHLPLINTLLLRGASPSYPSHYPLVRACQRGDVDMVKTLFAFGAPPEMTALRWACAEEQDEIIDLFLGMGVRPDGQCLSWCVERGKTRMIDKLLKMGVVPDLKTVLGF
ncbi:hypothetical protein BGX31_011454 [Mortierella sp. GBA43]|nr:hypothetical protein BGX31_011454 [Mortierella sp. GBA43]